MNEPGESEPSVETRRARVERARARAEHLAARALETVPGAPTALAAVERESGSGGGLLAGGLAYRFFFWVVSLGAVGGALSSIWAASNPADLEDAARSFGLTATAAESFREAVDVGTTPRWVFLVGGSILTLWFGTTAVKALAVVFTLAWRLPPPKIRRKVQASLLFTALSVVITAVAAALSSLEIEAPGGRILSFAALLGFYAVAATLAFSLLPHEPEARMRDHLPGAALLAVGMWAINVWVAVYLAPRLGKEGSVYGAFGTSTAILLWLYVTARLFTIAAFLNATAWERR
ncbi:MAG TPA: YhjD/YihY/BrkB family envelope integrity protein [Gaiellaceae bacterium]|nr:YhjD/YihY/BrkB family envelope integrity protein [Gaiellaceae bacterium]